MLLTVAPGAASSAAVDADVGARVRGEAERLQRLIETKTSYPAWHEAKPELEKALGRALAAASSGRSYLALEELGRARVQFQVLDAVEHGQEPIQKGLPGFEAEWQRASLDLAAAELAARNHGWSGEPAAIRALAESAQGRTLILLDAARAFAPVTDAKTGVSYLGQARGLAAFAEFCRGLGEFARARGERAERAERTLPSIEPALRRLQDETLAAFKPPRSIDRHSDFIQLNANLKFAGELEAGGRRAGAWYRYLDARQQFGRLAAPAATMPDADGQARIRAALQEQRARVNASPAADSIAEIFLQRAEAPLAAAPTADDWQHAAILAEQVVPAYYAAQAVEPAVQVAAKEPVNVTLVRWPYT